MRPATCAPRTLPAPQPSSPPLGSKEPYNVGAPGDWCIGNTAVSKTATPGSIPGFPARRRSTLTLISSTGELDR